MTTIPLSLALERIIAVIENSKYNPRANRKWLIEGATHYTLAGAIDLVCEELSDTEQQKEVLLKGVRRLIVGSFDQWSKRHRLADCANLPDPAMITMFYQEARKKKHVLAMLSAAYLEALSVEAELAQTKENVLVDASPLMDSYGSLDETMRSPWIVKNGHLVAEVNGDLITVGRVIAMPEVLLYLVAAHNVIHKLMQKAEAEHGYVHHQPSV